MYPPNNKDLTSQTRTKLMAATKLVDQMQELESHLHDEMLVAQAIYESWANKRRIPYPQYSAGDLNTRSIQTTRPAAKLDDRIL